MEGVFNVANGLNAACGVLAWFCCAAGTLIDAKELAAVAAGFGVEMAALRTSPLPETFGAERGVEELDGLSLLPFSRML